MGGARARRHHRRRGRHESDRQSRRRVASASAGGHRRPRESTTPTGAATPGPATASRFNNTISTTEDVFATGVTVAPSGNIAVVGAVVGDALAQHVQRRRRAALDVDLSAGGHGRARPRRLGRFVRQHVHRGCHERHGDVPHDARDGADRRLRRQHPPDEGLAHGGDALRGAHPRQRVHRVARERPERQHGPHELAVLHDARWSDLGKKWQAGPDAHRDVRRRLDPVGEELRGLGVLHGRRGRWEREQRLTPAASSGRTVDFGGGVRTPLDTTGFPPRSSSTTRTPDRTQTVGQAGESVTCAPSGCDFGSYVLSDEHQLRSVAGNVVAMGDDLGHAGASAAASGFGLATFPTYATSNIFLFGLSASARRER